MTLPLLGNTVACHHPVPAGTPRTTRTPEDTRA